MVKLIRLLPYLLSVVAFALANADEDKRECIEHIKSPTQISFNESDGCTRFNKVRDIICDISQCRDWLVNGDTWCNFWHKCENKCRTILKEKLDDNIAVNVMKIVVPNVNKKEIVVYDRGLCPGTYLDPCHVCAYEDQNVVAHPWDFYYH